MKRFRFPLESIQKLRQARLASETLRLRELHAQAERIKGQLQEFDADQRMAGESLFHAKVARTEELGAYEQFHRWGLSERERLAGAAREAEGRVRAQTAAVIEASKQVETLACLRERRLAVWRLEADRELEAVIADLVAARWKQGEGH